ncbi:serine hydrolase domain-containing protein [Actinomadura sp. 9N407]|uniref:serine hydrolase domain-containing protein n=1 Tax=Actinomadura sp. 9N407 TaxID=3375154 RepID=UPI0037B18795
MKKALSIVLCVLAALLCTAGPVSAGPVSAGPESAAAPPRLEGLPQLLDRVVPAQLAEHRIPGASVVVVAGGRQVLAKGYGVADTGTRAPVDPESTAFFTGSLAKLFTATAVMQLVRQGKLDLDADVNGRLATFKIEDTYPGRPVTLRHLLTYTAGFDDSVIGLAVRDPRDAGSLRDVLAERQPRRVRPPGAAISYDNYALALAGHLVEIASGTPYAKYLDRHVLGPIGMTGSTAAVPPPAAIAARLAKGYRPSGTGFATVSGQYGAITPSGPGTIATPADMGRFMLAHLGDDARLGGPEVTRTMRQRQHAQDDRMPGMGFTWEQRPRNGHELVYKDGDVPGFHSILALLPEQKIGVHVVYNGDGAEGNALSLGQSLVNQIVDRYLPAGAATAPVAAQGLNDDVSRYAGTYRSNRTSHSDLTRFNSLFGTVTVTAAGNGTLTTTGISLDPGKGTQHWVRTAPGLFAEKGGQERIAFDRKGTLTVSADPATTYTQLAWYDSPGLHLGLIAAGAAAFLIAFLAFPITAGVRAARRRPAHPGPARAARLLGWLAAALVTAFLTGTALVMSDGNAVMEAVSLGSPKLTALPYVATAAFAVSIAVLIAAVAAWFKGWWGRPGRIAYTLLALAAVPFFKLCITYHLVALPFPTF